MFPVPVGRMVPEESGLTWIDFGVGDEINFVEGELWAVLEDLKQAFYFDEIVLLKDFDELGRVVPHFGVEFAGAIGKRQRQIGIAGFFLANVFMLDEKCADDGLIRLKIGYER